MQLSLLEESKKKKMKNVHSLQKTIQEKDVEVKKLSQQIKRREDQEEDQTSMELVDMKMNKIQLQKEMDQLLTRLKLSLDEASFYQECVTSLARRSKEVEICIWPLSSMHSH